MHPRKGRMELRWNLTAVLHTRNVCWEHRSKPGAIVVSIVSLTVGGLRADFQDSCAAVERPEFRLTVSDGVLHEEQKTVLARGNSARGVNDDRGWMGTGEMVPLPTRSRQE